MTEKQKERIKKKIRSYRAKLYAEKRKFGGYFDNRGVRHYIPKLYVKIGDFKGLKGYFKWFAREFSDDIGFPDFNLLWSLSSFENKDLSDAMRKLYKTSFTNVYLVDVLCGRNPESIEKSELIWFESLGYALEVATECESFITPDFKAWMITATQSDEYRENMGEFIRLQILLAHEPVGEKRSKLINESRKFEKSLTGE